jgi:hypothetical protein
LSIVNIEKFNRGYLDRNNPFFKVSMNGIDSFGFMRLCEIDQMRFIRFLALQIKGKGPVAMDLEWLKGQGMCFKTRRLESTIRQLTEVELVVVQDGNGVGNSIGTGQEQEIQPVEKKEDTTSPILRKENKEKRIKSKEKKQQYVKNNPPSKEEAYKHFYDKGFKFSIDDFWGHYSDENINWSNAKGVPMRSWKSTMATWQTNWAEKHPNSDKPGYSGSMGYKRKDGTWSGGGY